MKSTGAAVSAFCGSGCSSRATTTTLSATEQFPSDGCRRTFLASSALIPFLGGMSTSYAVDVMSPGDAKITDKVFFKVRISRQDGTFYVRDDLPDTPENRVFYGTLVLGLFGMAAPNHVKQFMSYVNVDVSDETPYPSYGRSSFPRLDPATGVLSAGQIPSLQYTEVVGGRGAALKYGDRLLPASLWIDRTDSKISHIEKGLLTHRDLEVLPSFGITTRRDTRELDRSHTVFGKILFDESSKEFLEVIDTLPTYAMDRPLQEEDSLVDDAARKIFASQREFFRGAAKTLGDTRLDKVYEGKLLRRVEVTQVGRL